MNTDRAAEQTEVFLQMTLQKGALETDPDGNFLFDVEASNENLDLQQQRVLQRALLGSKDYFLKNGVVSKDHRHQKVEPGGKVTFDLPFVIGEPVDVYTDGGSVRVKGRLYKSNRYAQEFIQLLRDGSTRVKASVGGLMPKVVSKNEGGVKVGDIVSVLWNDLALTIAPINPTVGPAVMVAKSLSSLEFVKSLSAGSGTDSADFTGGRALQKEDVQNETVAADMTDEAVLISFVGAVTDGEITDYEDAVKFLGGFGISDGAARGIIRAAAEKNKEFLEVLPMAKSNVFNDTFALLKKAIDSFGKKPDEDEENEEEETSDETGKDEGQDQIEKGGLSNFEDALPTLKELAEHVVRLDETQDLIAKCLAKVFEQGAQSAELQKHIGKGLMALAERTDQIAASPAPRKGAVTSLEALLAKSMGGGGPADTAGAARRHRPFTAADLDEAKEILCKAVADKKLGILEAGLAETQINKSIQNPAYQIDEKFVKILCGGAQ